MFIGSSVVLLSAFEVGLGCGEAPPPASHDNRKNNPCTQVRLDSQPNQCMEVDLRENESVSVEPVGVLGVEGHELVEKNVSNRGHAHRGTGVTRVGFGGRIDLEEHLMSVRFIIDYPLAGDSRCMWRLNKRSQPLEA
jgi:hypothetical protein